MKTASANISYTIEFLSSIKRKVHFMLLKMLVIVSL